MPLCTNMKAFLFHIDSMADIITETKGLAYVLT